MIVLAASEYIAGVAASGSVISYLISGMELDASNVEAYKTLAQGQLSNSAGTLYTAPSLHTAFIKSIHLINTSASDVSGIILYASGTNAAHQITGSLTIPANGWAVMEEDGWRVYGPNGQLLMGAASGLGGTLYVQSSAPSSPAKGDRWLRTDDGIQTEWLDDGSGWVQTGPTQASIAASTSQAGLAELATQAQLQLKASSSLVPPASAFLNFHRGYLFGLTLSNNVADATNDIDVAAGVCAADTSPYPLMEISGLTKQLDAAWAAGTNAGGLDTGSIANTTYHVFVIMKTDGSATDVLYSASATSPTMPSGYTFKRRIGSIVRASAAIKAFVQRGDVFKWVTIVSDYSSTSARGDALLTLTIPLGIVVRPIIKTEFFSNAAALVFCSAGDASKGSSDVNFSLGYNSSSSSGEYAVVDTFFSNTSGQIYFMVTISSGALNGGTLHTLGWIDDRGRTA